MSRDRSVVIATRLRTGPSRNRGSVSGMGRVFLFSRGPLAAPFVGSWGCYSGSNVTGRGFRLTTHTPLVPRSRRSGDVPPLAHVPPHRWTSAVRRSVLLSY